MNRLIILLLLAATCAVAWCDTIPARPRFPVAGVAVPAATVAGAWVVSRAYPLGSAVQLQPGENTLPGVNVMQYVPLAAPWVLKACGVPSSSSWARMGVAEGSAVAVNAALVWGLKHIVDSPRPDGTDSRSFPSGHTAWVAAGATVIHREFSTVSGWYTLGAVAFASAVGMERVVDGRHYPTDIVAGAAVGVLAVNAGYFLADMIMGRRGVLRQTPPSETAGEPAMNLSVSNSLVIPLGHFRLSPSASVSRAPALLTSVGLLMPVGSVVSLSAAAEVESMPLNVITPSGRFHCGAVNSIGAVAEASLRLPVTRRVTVDASLGAGWHHRFHLRSVGRAVSAGGGFPLLRLGASVPFYIGDGLALSPALGVQLSRDRYRVDASETYGTDTPASASALTCSILLSLSASYEF